MTRLKETILVSMSIGCFILWIMEFRRTGNFGDHYWLIMLCLAFLLGFQYVRYQRKQKAGDQPAVPLRDKPSTAPKPGKKRKR
ncbi:hypothetical protein [Tellurirhabdus rosea]|uniref:hypothetical protein n=1 Tax=Tellurirhabdus rosea TaxID=2674997 RepID=UPI002258E8A1|nr:hypothetical protein [Tellurirhabdus rosea]